MAPVAEASRSAGRAGGDDAAHSGHAGDAAVDLRVRRVRGSSGFDPIKGGSPARGSGSRGDFVKESTVAGGNQALVSYERIYGQSEFAAS